jgi:hypothetical protein
MQTYRSSIYLIVALVVLVSCCEVKASDFPFPQKITGPHLQRNDCVSKTTGAEESFAPYIQEFVFTDQQVGVSLYSCINWREGFLKSEGIGKKQSKRAAELVAKNNALKTLLIFNLTSTATLYKYFEHQSRVKMNIQNVLIRDAKSQDLPSDLKKPEEANVMVTIPFYGISGLVSFFLDDQELYLPSPGSPSQPGTEVAPKNQELQNYTGIIIDASQFTTIEPALFPQILSEHGEILYAASRVDKDILRNHGMIQYVTKKTNLTAARSGLQPLIVKPLFLAAATDLGVMVDSGMFLAQVKSRKKQQEIIVQATDSAGQIPVNVVVSAEDAKKIKQANEQQHLDQQGSYTILIGGKIGGTEGQYPNSLLAYSE